MKKIILTATVGVSALFANAEGYQINTLSAKQNGMGHTGTAMHLGAESMIFNPAGMASLKNDVEFAGSVTGIFATATATLPSGVKYKTDNTPSTPMSAAFAFSVYDNFKAGLAFYTPYGSGINWTDNWPGAVLNQSVSLKTFTLQPTLSWEPIKGLSVGAGLMVTWGNVNLSKGLVEPSSFNTLQKVLIQTGQMQGATYLEYGPTTIPASIALNGSAKAAVGVNVGVMWDINPKWTLGFNYRSKMTMSVGSGDASLHYSNEHSIMILDNIIGLLNQSQFAAEMPCPAVYNFGVSFKPTNKFILALDAQLTGWNAYKSLDIRFLDDALSDFDQHIEKDYRNSWTFHFGCQYELTKRMDLRAGFMLDTTPVNRSHYNPETPGMTKYEPSVGFSFRPNKNISIDASLLYVVGAGAHNRSCNYPDVLMSKIQGKPVSTQFVADYNVHAFNPSIGFTLMF